MGLHHLETLSELTTILRGEMLDYHCAESPFHLRSFEDTVNLLMQDVQERLIFRWDGGRAGVPGSGGAPQYLCLLSVT